LKIKGLIGNPVITFGDGIRQYHTSGAIEEEYAIPGSKPPHSLWRWGAWLKTATLG
jgi:hypothetical protein